MPVIKKAKNLKKPKPKAKKTVKPRKPRPSKIINPEQRIEESKYYPGPVLQKFEEVKGYELPQGYDDNRIVLMVRDPYWIYAYWEINHKKIDEIRSALGGKFDGAHLILRVYDTQNWNFFDVHVSNLINNWYINAGRPNTAYCVDIGFLTNDGIFVVAARSNIVTTPREKMSELIDEEWMIPDWDKMYALSGGFKVGQGSLELSEMMEKRLLQQITSPTAKRRTE